VFKEVSLSYDAPAYARRYRELFNCPVHFNEPRTGVTIDKSWFERELQTNDDEFNSICVRHCEDVLHRIEHNQPVSAHLRNLFLTWNGPLPQLAVAARALNLSTRTLRRRLCQEGTKYRALVERFRAERACEYIRSNSMPPKQAAFLLGFNEPSAFRRAFKGWTGQTIGEYRSQPLREKAQGSHAY
jgi:AraC-like DNA-binding protein